VSVKKEKEKEKEKTGKEKTGDLEIGAT